MTITALFDTSYYTGGTTTSDVPSIYPVAINGRPYMLDTTPETFYVRWNHETIQFLRQQSDTSNAPAENSLNPQGYWRRAQDSWHHGAGQAYRDRDSQADTYRFRTSKGVDVWTRYQIGLLPTTTQKKSASNSNLYCVVAGSRIYFVDGANLYYSTDLSSWTAVTGYSGTTISSICSDGFTVYFSDGANIWTTNTSTGAATSADTKDATLLRYVKGRLMAAVGNHLYNIPTLGSAATLDYAHQSSAFTWVDCAEGNSVIYAAGYVGDKSSIYRTAIKADGTALDIPVVAGTLPDGEIVRAIRGYLGFLWIGTDKGVRFCEADASGNLTVGPIIATGAAVKAFEPQSNFMWFGMSNYDATSTGLGRMDLTTFVNTDQPAYASDLMVTGQGEVTSAATFTNLRVMTVSGLGIYAESTSLVSSGTIESGQIGYGLPDSKISAFLDVKSSALAGASYSAALSVDGGTYSTVGTTSTSGSTGSSFPTNQDEGNLFEVRLTLTAGGGTGPTITRWTLKSLPTSSDGPAEILHLPLLLANPLNIRDKEYACDVQTELNNISSLRATRQIVTCQVLDTSYTGIVLDFKFFPYGLTDESDGSWGMKGTCLVDFQRIG